MLIGSGALCVWCITGVVGCSRLRGFCRSGGVRDGVGCALEGCGPVGAGDPPPSFAEGQQIFPGRGDGTLLLF